MAVPNQTVARNFSSRLVASQPAIPSSTVALANPTGFDCEVYIYGGTVTVVSLSGTTVAVATPCRIAVAAGDTIALTYSVVPTAWQWFYASNVA